MISSNNYIVVNKQIAMAFGLEEAVILGELASELEYWQQRGELKDGYFYSTIENVKDNTTLSDKRQRSALNALKKAGIIDVKLAGMPAKRYIRINEHQLAPILLNNSGQNGVTSSAETGEQEPPTLPNNSGQNGVTCSAETAKQVPPKQQTNNNNINNNKNNNNKEIYIAVVDYLNSKAGTHYKPSSKATQQHINARLAEGFKQEDFLRVVDNMCTVWKGTEWEQYLRPSTLFGSKFENYLNRKTQNKGANGIAVNGKPSDLDGVF